MEHHAIGCFGHTYARGKLAHLYASVGPDVHVLMISEFGINDARELRMRASMMPVAAACQIFLLEINTITAEAQNALLKLFEDPPPRTQFYLVMSPAGTLLPTLRSRLFLIGEDETATDPIESATFDEFYGATYGDRLATVARLSKEKAYSVMEVLLVGAERVATEEKDATLLETVVYVRQHLGTRGASAKMLLESLSLALPKK